MLIRRGKSIFLANFIFLISLCFWGLVQAQEAENHSQKLNEEFSEETKKSSESRLSQIQIEEKLEYWQQEQESIQQDLHVLDRLLERLSNYNAEENEELEGLVAREFRLNHVENASLEIQNALLAGKIDD